MYVRRSARKAVFLKVNRNRSGSLRVCVFVSSWGTESTKAVETRVLYKGTYCTVAFGRSGRKRAKIVGDRILLPLHNNEDHQEAETLDEHRDKKIRPEESEQLPPQTEIVFQRSLRERHWEMGVLHEEPSPSLQLAAYCIALRPS